jgi:chromosome segregation ATPase
MKFKNLFVEEDAVATPKTRTPQAPVQTQVVQQSYQPTPTVDPAISDMINQSLQASKLDGFDYMKFISSVEKSKASGVPEAARFQMVYSTAQELGVDKAKLLKSGEHYLSVLKEVEDDSMNDCSNYEKTEIKTREAKLSQLESTMTDLSQKLAQAQQDHSGLQQEVADQKARLDSRKGAFQATLQTFRATIEQNIQKINQYLQ